MRLKGKVAVVTGGGSGIGRACSLAMARQGATVAVGDISPTSGAATVAEILKEGGSGWSQQFDVSDKDGVDSFARDVIERFGHVDILLNNAGAVFTATSVVDCSEADWERTFAVNVKGTFLVSRAIVPSMIGRRSGVVINMGSAAGLASRKNYVAYSASKGAIIALTRAMAADHGPQGIRVNCICPGPVHTPAFQHWVMDRSADPEAALRKAAAAQMLGRVGEPEDVANMVVFLASTESAWITGAVIPVDGGNTA